MLNNKKEQEILFPDTLWLDSIDLDKKVVYDSIIAQNPKLQKLEHESLLWENKVDVARKLGMPSFTVGIVSGFAEAIGANIRHGAGGYIRESIIIGAMCALHYSFPSIVFFTGSQFILQKMGLSKNSAGFIVWPAVLTLNVLAGNSLFLFAADTLLGLLVNTMSKSSVAQFASNVTNYSYSFFKQPREFDEDQTLAAPLASTLHL